MASRCTFSDDLYVDSKGISAIPDYIWVLQFNSIKSRCWKGAGRYSVVSAKGFVELNCHAFRGIRSRDPAVLNRDERIDVELSLPRERVIDLYGFSNCNDRIFEVWQGKSASAEWQVQIIRPIYFRIPIKKDCNSS